MTVQQLDIAVPDLAVPRMHPCQARGVGPFAIICGATPASEWLRWCLQGHRRKVRICGTHAALLMWGRLRCSECAAHGVVAQAMGTPLDLLLLGHAGRKDGPV